MHPKEILKQILPLSLVVAALATTIGWQMWPILLAQVSPGVAVYNVVVPQQVATSTTEVPEPTHPNNEIRHIAYLTAYTWYDNTPPGSPAIAFAREYGYPTVHNLAGGTGTYADPITIAVGHVIQNGVSIPDFTPGTLFYVPELLSYFMVEDLCGDGPTPQNGPCHLIDGADEGAELWLDIWIGGAHVSASYADQCARAMTRNYVIIENPKSNYPALGQEIIGETCRVDGI